MIKDLILKRPRYFYLVFVPFLIGGALLLFYHSKPGLFVIMNGYNHPFADTFFIYNTWLGSGYLFLLFCLVVSFRNIGNGILGLSVFTLSSILPQFLKKIIFTDTVRPMKYFEGDNSLHIVEGVKHHMYFSFPSGHATSAFALALFLTLIVKDKRWGIVFGAIAVLTAYSRVYIAQHFFEDIYAGACLGVFSTLLIFLFMEKWVRGIQRINRGIIKR